jgi:putative tricarboxylic transport membrane protein
MTRLYQTVAILIGLFGAFVIYLSLELSYSADYGPGPGFFSFWLGILLITLAAVDFIGMTRRPRQVLPKGFLPDKEGVRRLLYVSGSLVVALAVMKFLGFTLTILLFSVFLLRTMSRQSWWATLLIAVIGSVGTFQLFRLLQVSLPAGFLGM